MNRCWNYIEIAGADVYQFELIESKYLTLIEAKAREYAEAISNMMLIYHPNRIEGWINQAECLCELHGTEKAAEALLVSSLTLQDIGVRP